MTRPLFDSEETSPMRTPPVTIAIHGSDKTMEFMMYWWLAYVEGFDIEQHCQASLLGSKNLPNRTVRREMKLGVTYELSEADYKHLYLCGVSESGWANNYHLAMEYAPGHWIEKWSPDGRFVVRADNARELDIPALPDGYGGYPRSFTTCRNWQFGVKYYTDGNLPIQQIDESREKKRKKWSSGGGASVEEKAKAFSVLEGGPDFWFVFGKEGSERKTVTRRPGVGGTVRNCSCRYGGFQAIDMDCRCSHVVAVENFLKQQEQGDASGS